MKRITARGLPHHVIHRTIACRQTFLIENDYTVYLKIMAECCLLHDVEIWCYCLMPDHIHLIAVPGKKDSLSNCLGSAHGRYARYINNRTITQGPFWRKRFSSHLLDEQYLIACTRYIEINPVKREYVDQPEAWPWSSARAHMMGIDDILVKVAPMFERVQRPWQNFLAETREDGEADLFYLHEKNGRPLGRDDFLAMLEKIQ